MRYYDRKEAVGARLTRQVDKGRVAAEVYMLHEVILPDREILLLTHRRLLYIQVHWPSVRFITDTAFWINSGPANRSDPVCCIAHRRAML